MTFDQFYYCLLLHTFSFIPYSNWVGLGSDNLWVVFDVDQFISNTYDFLHKTVKYNQASAESQLSLLKGLLRPSAWTYPLELSQCSCRASLKHFQT